MDRTAETQEMKHIGKSEQVCYTNKDVQEIVQNRTQGQGIRETEKIGSDSSFNSML